ncbi:hypothetical protein DPMN_180406 [Dreissena polymorpha]|uniref:Uncharacterized protein n=1 Tax=Dreissena polymorpha TaxID=45954 RepID=A0A9D4EE55_DREPO|nr:hypothetical protein DPMN_180406 [Dreissena polymorpha]
MSGQQDRQANRSVTPHSTQSGSNAYVSYATDHKAVQETAIYVTIRSKPEVMATKITHQDEAPGRAIHVMEEAVFRSKPKVTATESMHQVMT